MKALVCTRCNDIRALPSGEHVKEIVECRCGACRARWLDAIRGIVKVQAKDRMAPRILGMHNHFLVNACTPSYLTDEMWRDLHKEAIDAPGYVFDVNKRGCWAAIVRIGDTSDVSFEDWDAHL